MCWYMRLSCIGEGKGRGGEGRGGEGVKRDSSHVISPSSHSSSGPHLRKRGLQAQPLSQSEPLSGTLLSAWPRVRL